jgi:hypothetical protein
MLKNTYKGNAVFYRFLYLLLFVSSLSSADTLDCDWPFQSQFNITDVSGQDLTDYQIKLELSGSDLNSLYAWTIDGYDLRIVANDGSPLEFWIDEWDQATETMDVWVRFPYIAANSTTSIFLLYGNDNATALANVPFTFIEPGIKFHTKPSSGSVSSSDSRTDLINEFESIEDTGTGTNGYGCTFINDFDGITRNSQFGGVTSLNFMALSESYFEVDEVGIWEFRYGADFGGGGALFVDNTKLDLNTGDLWWAGDWTNADVLQGSINLTTSGYHKLEIIGFEGCCDGGITVQYKKPSGVWQTFDTSTGDIDIRSRACPVEEPSITFVGHEICDLVDLRVRNNGLDIPTSWERNVPQDISFGLRNTNSGTATSTAPITVNITVPTGFNLTSFTGSNWSNCLKISDVISCQYGNALAKNSNSDAITLSFLPGSSTVVGSGDIIVEVTPTLYDVVRSNNTVITTTSLVDNNALPSITPTCTPQQGIWAQFFDTTNYTGSGTYPYILNATDMQTFVSANKNAGQLDGQTILPNIYGLVNPFNDAITDVDDNYFLSVFEGYIKVPSTDDYTFDVDGDDAIEFWLDGSVISTYYGLHGTNGVPQNQIEVRLAEGFHAIEYRMQEHTGGAVYRLFTREGGGNIRNGDITPDSYFYHCAGNTDITIESSINVESDGINVASLAKAIPNSIVKYTVTGTNKGNISTDYGSTIITQKIDENNELFVKDLNGGGEGPIHFIDGSSTDASGLSYSYNAIDGLGDSLWFSTDGSTYTESTDLTNDYNAAITHFQIRFDGSLKASINTAEPKFIFEYQVRVK